jgi:hypothetical protein
MVLLMAAACGFGLSIALLSTSLATRANAAPASPEVGAAMDLSGRWKGSPKGYADALKNCGQQGCALTLDLSACGDAWCGVRVENDGKCVPGIAMRITAKRPNPKVNEESNGAPAFEGKLELAANTQPYVIEALLWTTSPDVAPQLRIIGDTGGEMLMMRRSFPLQATMARIGDASCKVDKPVS